MYYNTSAGKTPDVTRHFFFRQMHKKEEKAPSKGSFSANSQRVPAARAAAQRLYFAFDSQ